LAKGKQYIYIVQSSKELTKCKIGKTNNLERRLKEYNNMTGKSKDNVYEYLMTCEVKDMATVENDLKYKFVTLREEKSKEIYFFNTHWYNEYVKFIKSHPLFINETYIKTEDKKQIVKIIKTTRPSLEERGILQNVLMKKAQKAENDEFYTIYEDVVKELSMYDKKIWKDKTVFCNCDDAVGDSDKHTSAFPLYFLHNFKELGLDKLICTHYEGKVDLFNEGSRAYIFTKKGFREGIKEYPKNYSGSFDHPLSLKILKEEADIVCTNPPFSRSHDFWDILIKSGKKYIIVSNEANIVTTYFIKYFQSKKIWAGHNEIHYFLTPKKELVRAPAFWFTNIIIKNRPRYKQLKIIPLKDIPDKYKEYDDNNTLLVDHNYIPSDYKKMFAVSTRPIINGLLEKGYKIVSDKTFHPYKNGKMGFARVLVQKE